MVLSLGWAFASVFGTCKFLTPAGAVAAGLGAAAAVVLTHILTAPRFSAGKPLFRRMHGDLLLPLLTAGTAWLSAWIFEHLFFFSITFHLLAREALMAALVAFSLVYFLRSLVHRFPAAGFLEVGVAVTLSVSLVSGHRQTLEHPFWLMDLFMRNGTDPLVAIKVIGLAGCLLAACMLFGTHTPSGGKANHSITSAALGVLMILLVTLAIYRFAPQREAPLVQSSPPPVAPKSGDEPPPPPPPQPNIVAWVEFLDSCKATKRLGGLYFRQRVIEDAQQIWQLSQDDNANTPDTPSDTPPANGDENGLVTTRVHLMAATNATPQPPVLISGLGATVSIPTRDKRFTASWEIRSRVPGKDSMEDLRMDSPRMKLLNSDWSAGECSRLKALPPEIKFLPMAGDSILKTLEGYRAGFDNARLAAVLTLTTAEFQGRDGEWGFPENAAQNADGKRKPADLRELSRRAVLLLRAVGIPCRLASGFKYPMVEDEEKSALVLADSHKTWWPEVYLKDTGWLPVVIPLEGGAKGEPPNLSTIEEMLAASLDTELTALTTVPPQVHTCGKFWKYIVPELALIWIYPLWFLILVPVFSPSRRRPLATLRAASALLALDGHCRSYGETRSDFAKRLPAQLGEPMLRLAEAFEHTKWNDESLPPRGITLCPLIQIIGWAIPRGIVRVAKGIIARNGQALVAGMLWYLRPCNPQFLHQADKPTPTNTRINHER